MEETQQLIEENKSNNVIYIPSSSEKKKVVMMYLIFGIMVYISKHEMTPFEYYHLRQSVGFLILFVLVLIVSLLLLFLPIIGGLGFLLVLLLIILQGYFINQAWNGKYKLIGGSKSPLDLFVFIGDWILNLFEIAIKVVGDKVDDSISSLNDLIQK